MIEKWLIKEKRENLLLFFNGWGMDENLFSRLKSDKYDIKIFYDYKIIDKVDINEFIREYKKIDVFAWSFGVWAANDVLKEYKDLLNETVGINGTLTPIDNAYGIPEKIFDLTLDNYSDAGKLTFIKRMCSNNNELSDFINNTLNRNVIDQKEELQILKNMLKETTEENIFNHSLIGEKDKIIPAKNQINFWKDKIKYKLLDSPHYIFHLFNYWEEILDYVKDN